MEGVFLPQEGPQCVAISLELDELCYNMNLLSAAEGWMCGV